MLESPSSGDAASVSAKLVEPGEVAARAAAPDSGMGARTAPKDATVWDMKFNL